MAKKQTPGKGGAKGMHHGHTYKETCACAICKSKRKKLDSKQPEIVTEIMNKVNYTLPVFERADTPHEYVARITWKGITEQNYTGTFDPVKGEILFVVGGKYKKVFECKEHEVTPERGIINTIKDDVLTVYIPRKQVPLTADTINQFPQGESIDIKRNEPTTNTSTQAEVETPQVSQRVTENTSQNTENGKTLSGKITITDETFSVMKQHGRKLSTIFKLQPGFDHGKFINDLANRAIVFFCNHTK